MKNIKHFTIFTNLRAAIAARSRRGIRLATVLACAGVMVGLVGTLATCGQETALLLTVGSTVKVTSFDLLVKDLDTGKIVLKLEDEAVDAENPDRDISQKGQELRVAVEFANPGIYLVYMLGKGGTSTSPVVQFYINDFEVSEVRSEEISLVPLVNDVDKDNFPACNSPGISCSLMSCKYLDCNDNDKTIHPFSKEVCGNGKDDDCSEGCNAAKGAGDDKCVDKDGDKVPEGQDCDDNDPCRSPKILEARNMCDKKSGKCKTLDASAFKLPDACKKKMTAPYCGDGIDQDCDGQDTACFKDDDCDDYRPPSDCNDKNCSINPGADEICTNKIDDNCNNVINEGCIACDVDGDNFAAKGSSCNLPETDPDDYDSGVFPTVTKSTDTKEGGSVLGALREFCSNKVGKDGKKSRDVDHDGDKLPASLDGCPKSACDVDGDGFMNNSTGCNPSITKLDCRDNDSRSFPGAPDKCGDGITQNCHSDNKCADVTDKDNDGYSPPEDCDDSNKEIHPWATEKCDGVDNDCDGLVDEGNPDATGKPIDTLRMQCTDDNDGQCFPPCKAGDKGCVDGVTYKKPKAQPNTKYRLSGVCACSRQKPKGVQEKGNRVVCSGEDLSAKASLRCFGAIPSSKREHCDTLDHDCNGRPDAPVANSKEAQNLNEYNTSCGLTEGTCKQGVVVGCDLTKKVANEALVKKVLPKYNVHLLCDKANFPVPESKQGDPGWCNGKDDDCNKDVPQRERDKDGDKFIECSVKVGNDCPRGSKRFELDPTKYKGCGDCNDKLNTTFPKAPENCNNDDDNCSKFSDPKHVTGLEDDGQSQCPPKGMVCCSTQKACKNIKTDFFNCGGCGKACKGLTASDCVGGVCMCGGVGACGGGRNCKSKKCECITGGTSMCAGCCDGVACLPLASQSVSKCGFKEKCKSCDDGNDCTKDECVNGKCKNTQRPSRFACKLKGVVGQCVGTSCCTGCVSGGQCMQGKDPNVCGWKGENCVKCYTPNKCKYTTCPNGYCGFPDHPTTKECDDGKYCTIKDHCASGACVGGGTRSCPGDQCRAGQCNESKHCFKVPINEGKTCNDGQFCTKTDKCVNGICGGSGSPCVGSAGQCMKWACNESANTCYAIPDPSKNGDSCNDGAYCTKTDKCDNGTCKGAGTPCSGNAGQCKKWFCNDGTDACTPVNDSGQNGKSCSDGLFCTKTDTCATGSCVGSGNPCSGLTPSQCNKYVCNEPTNTCNQTADASKNGSSCSDGQFCTSGDKCNNGSCAAGTGSPCSGNPGACKKWKCNEGSNNCTAVADDSASCGSGCTCSGGNKTETNCADLLDNDGDGKANCADSDCNGKSCGTGCTCQYGTETSCTDGFDNDGDAKKDCADSDCNGASCGTGCACGGGYKTETNCSDTVDNDGDTSIDCLDSDCAGKSCGTGCTCSSLAKTETNCGDTVDNDGDTSTDCADSDCAGEVCATGKTCQSGVCSP